MGNLHEYEFIVANTQEHFLAAKDLFSEYAASLDFDLQYQQFDQELDEIDVQYNLPFGGLILICHLQDYIGCGSVRRFEKAIGEIKRMYIRPAYRGLGLGKNLLEKLIDLARERGYERVRLDTKQSMTAASQLYRKLGFYDIAAYRFNPTEDVFYFEKVIR